MLTVVEDQAEEEACSLDELAREGARRMLQSALATEVAAYIERYQDELDEGEHRLVVRNGKARARKVTCGAGTFEIRAPRVNDKREDEDGERQRFSSAILPPYMRRSPKVSEVLPVLYLRGLSTGDFRPALRSLLGEDAAGLSATNISRLIASVAPFARKGAARRNLLQAQLPPVSFRGKNRSLRPEEHLLALEPVDTEGKHRRRVDRRRDQEHRNCVPLEDARPGFLEC